MDSIQDFFESLKEIDILITYAQRNQSDIIKYRLFNKSAVILLLTKFENFIETFLEEHSYEMLENHTNHSISHDMKVKYISNAVDKANGIPDDEKKSKIIEKLSCLIVKEETTLYDLKDFRPRTAFNYGKHGSTEIEKMFALHAFGKFIGSQEVRMLLKNIDSLIAIRNNIIHQDATPSLTHQDIMNHKNHIMKFVKLLQNDIENNADKYYNVH